MMEVLYWVTFAGAILALVVNAFMWMEDSNKHEKK